MSADADRRRGMARLALWADALAEPGERGRLLVHRDRVVPGPRARVRLAGGGGLFEDVARLIESEALRDGSSPERLRDRIAGLAAEPWGSFAALLGVLLDRALRAERGHRHYHFWLSETLRGCLDRWLEEPGGEPRWRELRRLAQRGVTAGINLRHRSPEVALAALSGLGDEPRFGLLPPDAEEDPGRAFATALFALSWAGPRPLAALRLCAVAPGLPGAAGWLAGLGCGAFLGAASLGGLVEDGLRLDGELARLEEAWSLETGRPPEEIIAMSAEDPRGPDDGRS